MFVWPRVEIVRLFEGNVGIFVKNVGETRVDSVVRSWA